jgi:hypothetical protein
VEENWFEKIKNKAKEEGKKEISVQLTVQQLLECGNE